MSIERRRPVKSQGPGAGALISIVLILGTAIAVAYWVAQNPEQEATPEVADTSGYVPFSNVKEEAPPPPKVAKNRGTKKPLAPDGLLQDPLWVQAQEIVADAYKESDLAQKARLAEDHAAFQTHGKAAKETFDRALILTADWEAELIDKYRESGPQMREITTTRNDWFAKVRYFHKTTGR